MKNIVKIISRSEKQAKSALNKTPAVKTALLNKKKKIQTPNNANLREKKNEELQQEVQDWQATFDANSDAICLLDNNQRILRCNHAMAKMFGVAQEKLLGRHCWEVVHNSAKPIPQCPVIRTKSSLVREEMELQMKDRWFNVTADPILDERGSLRGLVHIVRDITERKLIEEKLRREEQRFRTLAEQSSDIIVFVNRKGVITYENPAVEKCLGFQPKERIGSSMFDLIHPDDLKIANDIFNMLNKSAKASVQRTEMRLRHKDGSWHTFEVTVNNILNDKVIEGGIINLRDITERKRAEETMRKSEERYRRITENMSDFVSELHTQGIFRYNSPSIRRILGYDPEELIGTSAFNLVHPEDRDFVIATYMDGINTESDKYVEQRYRRKDGTYIWLRSSGHLLYGSDGKNIGMIVNSNDITERKLAEESIREIELKFRTIFDSASDGILLAQVSNRKFSTANNKMCEMLGYTNEELLNLGISDIHPAESLLYVIDQFEKLLQKEILIAHNIPVMRKDKTVFFADVGASPIILDGKDCIIGMFRDITERKRSEEEIKSAKVFLDMIIDMSPFAMWISDKQGTITRANLSLCDVINLPEDKIVGKYNVLKDENLEIQGVMPMVRNVFEKHEPARFIIPWKAADAGNVDFKGTRNIHIDVSMFPILNAQEELINVVCQWVDITERKQAEQALRDTERQLRTLVDNLPDCIARFDAECRHTFVNKATMNTFGLQSIDVIGKTLCECGAPAKEQDNILMEGILRQIFEEAIPIRVEAEWLTSKGPRNFDILHVPELDECGRVVSVLGIGHDITERKQAEEKLNKYNEHLEDLVKERTIKLEASNKELEAFSYSASHDLRAPLRTIDGFSQALLEDFEDKLNTQGKDYLTRIRKATQLMAELIEDMLTLSRITRTDMDIVNVNLTQIARSVINELEKSQPERDINIKIADGLEVFADPRLMRIVFENLLGNAWKFTGKQAKTEIEVGTITKDGQKAFFIRDNGVGFDMEYADKLFAPFQRLHNADEYPGTGVGLATVQRIINRHGGKAWAESKTGEGATFYFSLHV